MNCRARKVGGMQSASRRSARPSRKAGFTMLEATVSMIVLGAAVTTVVQLAAHSNRLQHEMDRRLLAQVELANVMDRVLAKPFADVTHDSLAAMTLTEVGQRRLPAAKISTSIEVGTVEDLDGDRDASDNAAENAADGESSEDVISARPLNFKRIVLRLQWNDASGSPVEPIELVAWKHEAGAGQGKEAARP